MPRIFATTDALIGFSCFSSHSSHFIVIFVNSVNIVAFRPCDRNLLEFIASYATDTALHDAQLGDSDAKKRKTLLSFLAI